jgi:hypothetical protein
MTPQKSTLDSLRILPWFLSYRSRISTFNSSYPIEIEIQHSLSAATLATCIYLNGDKVLFGTDWDQDRIT